jgi:hypothetical protein
MKTVFALFERYVPASDAVDALLDGGFRSSEVNAIVDSDVAKTNMEVNQRQAATAVAGKAGEQELHGLDRLLAAEEPAMVPRLGLVYAVGDVATTLTTVSGLEGGLKASLLDFGIPVEEAAAYEEGVDSGSVLVFVRANDERAGAAAELFHEQGGMHVTAVG